MNKSAILVDDFLDLLLRDASVRVGLDSMKTKPSEWMMLMSSEGINDVQRIQRLKTVAYVMHHLLNAKELMNSFSDYFEQKMKMPFKKSIVGSNERGKEITLIDQYKRKISKFKSNFAHLSQSKYKMSISKGENHLGGKGIKARGVRTHEEILFQRRQKRSTKKQHQGKVFFLNCFMSDGQKLVQVRLSTEIF